MKSLRILPIFIALIVGFSIVIESRAAFGVGPKGAAADDSLVGDLFLLSSNDEEKYEVALLRLKARTRQDVVKGVYGLLKSPQNQPMAYRAIAILELTEMLPELKKSVATSGAYQLFLAINGLLAADKAAAGASKELSKEHEAVIALYLQRLGSDAPMAVKMALLEGLSLLDREIPRDLFTRLIADEQLQVRVSAVEHFLSTRKSHSTAEQSFRFRESFKLKPFQARLTAFEHFDQLSAAEKKKLKDAFDPGSCQTESKEEVQKVCRKIASVVAPVKNGTKKREGR
jgi:hypothetical protein